MTIVGAEQLAGVLAFVGWVQNGATDWLSKGVYTVDVRTGDTRVVMSPYRVGSIDW